MVDNTIAVNITGDASQVKAAFATASAAIEQVMQQLQQSGAALAQAQTALNSVGKVAGDTGQDAKKLAASWRSALAEITSAESGFVSAVFSKRQSLGRSLAQMGRRMVEEEISNDLRWLTMKQLYNLLGLKSDQDAASGGFLAHAVAELDKTAATETGAAARTAANTAAAKTSGTADSAAASQSILKNAASAAAAVYNDVAQIPYVGWVLAPVAAAAAFAAVMAFDTLIPSAAGGMVVGQDGLIMAHAQEMVLPASISTGLQGMIAGNAGGGAPGSGGGGITFAPQVSALDAKSVVALFNNPSIMRQFAANLSRYMDLNPSVRGAY
jgi:hypothetical protein